jgi:signal transduction histidine kinase/CheY-like chemotaxis protein
MESQEGTHPTRILIVDDHPNTAIMLARVLSRFDTPVEVMTASSGEDALEKVGDSMVDILITDFMMPGMNGLELIEKFKGEKKPTHTILITAYDTPGLAITARRLNVQDYLVKPVQPERIRSIVAKVLEELHPQRKVIAGPRRQFKILIADDYPDNLRLLSSRLQSEGYNFLPAWDGEETLEKVYSEKPDLVLLDVNMPKKDGFQVLAAMRADPEVAHIPVIMITAARIGPKDVREGLTLGADDYVIKPFDWRELAARIQSKLRVKQAEDIMRRRTRELELLPEIGQELSARLDVRELADTILNRTVKVLEAVSARLDILQPDGGVFSRERRSIDAEPVTLLTTREEVFARGLIEQVFKTRSGLVIQNIVEDDRWVKSPSEPGGDATAPVSAVGVPLLGRRDVIGVLTLTNDQPGFFTEDHQTLLQAIASQAAIAIENAQLFNVEHKRVQDLISLNQITREINRFTYLRQILENLPRLVQQGLEYPCVSMWNGISNQAEVLKLCSIAGNAQGIDPDLMVTIPQKVASTGKTYLLSDPVKTPSVIAVPVVNDERIRGVLAVFSPNAGSFQEGDRVLLETLATQVSSALERIGLFESVEQEQRRLLAVLRSAADAILVIDAQGNLTLANPAGEKLFKEQQEIVQENGVIETWVDKPLPLGHGYDEMLTLLEKARLSGMHQQGEVHWPDGRTFSVLVTPVEEGGQVAMLHDVSQFKALAELKNEYIATASHDLKNPIMSLLGYNDLLSKAGPLTEMQEEFSRRIRSSALQMRDLVLNLLEVSRLESGMPMKLEIIDLHALLAEMVQELDEQARAKEHTVVLQFCDAQPLIRGDRTLLQQLIQNLLGNAIKYTPQEGRIVLETQIKSTRALISIRDNGVGIPAEDLPYIFNKFFRSRTDATKDIEGTGLGLAIVQSIVENHGGQITVQSKPGEGTIFFVSLPFETPGKIGDIDGR